MSESFSVPVTSDYEKYNVVTASQKIAVEVINPLDVTKLLRDDRMAEVDELIAQLEKDRKFTEADKVRRIKEDWPYVQSAIVTDCNSGKKFREFYKGLTGIEIKDGHTDEEWKRRYKNMVEALKLELNQDL